jgi:hypothetical protein
MLHFGLSCQLQMTAITVSLIYEIYSLVSLSLILMEIGLDYKFERRVYTHFCGLFRRESLTLCVLVTYVDVLLINYLDKVLRAQHTTLSCDGVIFGDEN